MATTATKLNGTQKVQSPPGPYRVKFTIVGTKPILMHAYKPDAVALKANAKKGSSTKKEDNPEDYIYRTDAGTLAIPAINLHACLIEQGRSRPDPRSPRKSARDLMKAAICPDDELVEFDQKFETWDFLDQRRVCMNGKSAITRIRPGLLKGWSLTATFTVLLPGYCDEEFLLELINDAGQYQGLGDFRPVFGRFACRAFERLED